MGKTLWFEMVHLWLYRLPALLQARQLLLRPPLMLRQVRRLQPDQPRVLLQRQKMLRLLPLPLESSLEYRAAKSPANAEVVELVDTYV